MRILFVPLYTNPSIRHCTTYIFAKNFLRAIVDVDPHAYVYLPVPTEVRDCDFSEVAHDRILLLPMKHEIGHFPGMLAIPPEITSLFNDRTGRYFADIVFTTIPSSVTSMSLAMYGYAPNRSRPPLWVSLVMYGLPAKRILSALLYQQAIGLLASDMTVWQSNASKQRALDGVRTILSPASYQAIMDKAYDVRLTAVPTRTLCSIPQAKPKDRYVVNYGWSLSSVYRVQETFTVLDNVFSAGWNVEIVVTTSSGSINFIGKRFRKTFEKRMGAHFEMVYRLPQDAFWARAAEAHAFLFLGKDVESSFSVVEQFMLGAVGVLMDGRYSREVTYPGYPYLCKNLLESATTLRYVLEHYYSEEVQGVLARQQAYVREKFDIEMNARMIYAESVARKRAVSGGDLNPSTKALFDKCFAGCDRIEWADFVERISAESEVADLTGHLRPLESGRSLWRWRMEQYGYEDECLSPDPVFVRRAI